MFPAMSATNPAVLANRLTRGVPAHLAGWQLPPDWRWGGEGVLTEHRHYQEVVDALGRSLSLVSAPDAAHAPWLAAEARHLAHLNHPSVPTTYHYWASSRDSRRGPGYLRRWIAGETVGSRLRRLGTEDVPYALQVLRAAASAVAYLHDLGSVHGALGQEVVWVTPTGRLWLLGWQWTVQRDQLPSGAAPAARWMSTPPEWAVGSWLPTPASDQWQLAAICFAALTGEPPPSADVPPLRWVRPECPQGVAAVLDRALLPDPANRHPSVASMLRLLDRGVSARPGIFVGEGMSARGDSDEARLRWATADDYDVLSALGRGTFGSVWRVRDLSLEREVALKMLHPHVSKDDQAVSRFRREARLAAHLAHPAIVPIYDWDSRHDVSWYTMELAEGGSVADLVARAGPRPLAEVAPQVEALLDALAAAHATGIIHRDLKPENVLIDRYRRWRITDFGIANMPGEELAGPTGTPAFSAPEQLLGEPQGATVDLFAVAAIVMYVLTGRAPFGETDSATILARELSGRFESEGVAAPISAWAAQGLNPDPEGRFPDAATMLGAWRQAVEAAECEARRGLWWRRLLGRA
jgi:serine/threonine-protein kinase